MGIDLSKLWEVFSNLLDTGKEFVEEQVEKGYEALHVTLVEKAKSTTTTFDDKSIQVVELGIRDKLIKLYPLEEYPLD